eukprot:scaffold21186_cov67-Phaeocystis_antarctica.AAC.5
MDRLAVPPEQHKAWRRAERELLHAWLRRLGVSAPATGNDAAQVHGGAAASPSPDLDPDPDPDPNPSPNPDPDPHPISRRPAAMSRLRRSLPRRWAPCWARTARSNPSPSPSPSPNPNPGPSPSPSPSPNPGPNPGPNPNQARTVCSCSRSPQDLYTVPLLRN